ncbi:hypothetical protein LCGC14_2169450 [marine sediment metagenome]|uniref:DNA methylase N-4/N-6 domain-containing protein n=1 Tax=marine sediment metagenome TaxID=412755 RepID=A0A0F9DQC5_9ZZZZ
MSYGLLKRILSHCKDEGWEGIIVDPFGGIGSTGILGAYEGYQVICVELERKFVDLARQNFVLHYKAWTEFGNPWPIIIQGDSRGLCEIVESAVDIIVSSPPFIESLQSNDPEFHAKWCKQHGRDVTKPNYKGKIDGYGQTPGQLGSMKPGKVDMVIKKDLTNKTTSTIISKKQENAYDTETSQSSRNVSIGNDDIPHSKGNRQMSAGCNETFTESGVQNPQTKSHREMAKTKERNRMAVSHDGFQPESDSGVSIIWEILKKYGLVISDVMNREMGSGSPVLSLPHEHNEKEVVEGKESGDSDPKKQCASGMEIGLIISSPPYEEGIGHGGNPTSTDKEKALHIANSKRYSETNENLGNQRGDTFWQAAKEIVQQCYQLLKPGGHAIWVTKAFVRKGAIVDFPGDWRQLCESVGFETVCVHHAMLVNETTENGLFGEMTEKKERKSFFRRLAESKGSPPIDYEVILCMSKPLGD